MSVLYQIRVRVVCHLQDVPFFWAADTAWNMLIKANVTEANEYFEQRKKQGFNVVQAVATGIGLNGQDPQMQSDRNGAFPWLAHDGTPVPPPGTGGFDITRPNPAFFDHVDSILDVAAAVRPPTLPHVV